MPMSGFYDDSILCCYMATKEKKRGGFVDGLRLSIATNPVSTCGAIYLPSY